MARKRSQTDKEKIKILVTAIEFIFNTTRCDNMDQSTKLSTIETSAVFALDRIGHLSLYKELSYQLAMMFPSPNQERPSEDQP